MRSDLQKICKMIYDNRSFTPSGVVLTSDRTSNTRNLIHSEQHQGMWIRRDYASHTIRNRCYSKRWTNSSFGKIVSSELCKYLKTSTEFSEDKPVIQRNTDVVQKEYETICGHLCLYVLDNLSQGKDFAEVITTLWYGSKRGAKEVLLFENAVEK